MMIHSDAEDNMLQARQLQKQNHVLIPFPRDRESVNLIKAPTCMMKSLEEGVIRSEIDNSRKKARKCSRRLGHLSVCNDPNFDIFAHSCCPVEIRMNSLPLLKGLSCFKIVHDEYCKDAFVDVERKHTRSLRKYPTHEEIANLHSNLK